MFSRGKNRSAASSASGSVDFKDEFIELDEGAPSILSNAIVIKGNVQKNGDLHIEGELQGNMRARTVTIGSTAHINGNISGEHVRCAGKVAGNITARVVELFSTAQVQGNILHETLAIEAGAKLEGLCRRGTDLGKHMDKASQEDGFEPMSIAHKNLEKKSSRSILGFGNGSVASGVKDKVSSLETTATK